MSIGIALHLNSGEEKKDEENGEQGQMTTAKSDDEDFDFDDDGEFDGEGEEESMAKSREV